MKKNIKVLSSVAILRVYSDVPREDESSRILDLRKQGYSLVIKYTGDNGGYYYVNK